MAVSPTPTGAVIKIPAWMFSGEASQFQLGAKPIIELRSLLKVAEVVRRARRVLDDTVDCSLSKSEEIFRKEAAVEAETVAISRSADCIQQADESRSRSSGSLGGPDGSGDLRGLPETTECAS